MGLAFLLTKGEVAGLFAVLATPMTLAFFGVPGLVNSLILIPATYYALSSIGHRRMVPYVVFAVGAAILLYLFIAKPAPSGAIPGYDQTAQGFTAATFILWALYAHFRLGLRQL